MRSQACKGAARTLLGGLTVRGGVKNLTLGEIGGVVPTTLDGNGIGSPVPITLGGTLPSTLTLGNVTAANLTSAAPINRLTASTWQSGTLDAPSLGTLAIQGEFGADVHTHAAGKLQSARLRAITGGTWAIAGAVNSLRVMGDITNASIFAGADAGLDNTLGTADDVFGGLTLNSIVIGGGIPQA